MNAAGEASSEIRCPACSRLLVLRSGPKVAPHYAHRPRQSCRRRPGRAGRAPLRLEQLTLFELAALDPSPIVPAPPTSARRAVRRRRRRRRAWLPRLVRWFSRVRGPAPPGLHP